MTVMSLSDITFPAAWTPASVRAARFRPTFHESIRDQETNVLHAHLDWIICIILRNGSGRDQRFEQNPFNGGQFWLAE